MSSDPKNYFGFLVDEISEPGLTHDNSATYAKNDWPFIDNFYQWFD